MAMGHVILKEFHLDRTTPYFADYTRRYTDMPFLVRLEKRRDAFVAGRFLRASDFAEGLGQTNNPDWKTVALDESSGDVVAPNGSRSEEHTSELQSLMRNSYAVFCL